MRFPIDSRALAGAFAAALIVAAPVAPLDAQRTDEEWLEDCGDHGRGGDEREVVCEIRTLEPRLAGRLLTVDGMRNGGVHVEASDQPCVHVSARIQTRARRLEDAAALARELPIVADRHRPRGEGPAPGGHACWPGS